MPHSKLSNDPLWFKDAIIYEVPVRAYSDSNGDGIGDFAGLTEKLDYLRDLGVTAIWILPFFPSPLRDDGYDISDYRDVNPIYGNLDDFKTFLDAAHDRGIRVIIELVVNHTSDQHPWFQRARRLPKGSKEREFYVWSDTPDKYPEVRIIFQDFETSNWAWDPVAKAYYWHRFYSHQPDLNYESPELQQAVLDLADFWLGMGVDGMRLDAVPYLCVREGTNCENLPETHAFLKRLRAHIDSKYANRMLLAEANQWPEDAAAYYGEGDECQMNFHFPLMPRLFMALRMEDSFPIIDILKQTPAIPGNCQWALFLRNHDELTLEMVTDEDRDYMYRVYAQDTQARLNLGIRRRLAPLLGNDRRQIELMNSLLLSLPGTPVLYYGDEIGMGDNIYIGDRNGVRTPMQWSPDRNAGFSRANPQKLYQPVILDSEYHYEAINVEAQSANPNSLLSWMKRLIAIRKRFQAFGRGTFELLHPENRKVFAFVRTYAGEHILVVANLSRFVQGVDLDLTPFQGMVPVEIFGRNQFPKIGESSYFLSVAPYGFYWFILQFDPTQSLLPRPRHELPALEVAGNWHQIFTQTDTRERLESLFPEYLHRSPWFAGKSRIMQSVTIAESIRIPLLDRETAIVLLNVEYTEGFPETYVALLAYAEDELARQINTQLPSAVLASVNVDGEEGVLFEASADQEFLTLPLDMIRNRRQYSGQHGSLTAIATDAIGNLDMSAEQLNPQLMREAAKNALVVYGDRLIFKLFRRVEAGINPELEIRNFLGHKRQLEHIAPVMGGLEYKSRRGESMTLGVLQIYVPDAIKAWNYTLDSLRDFFDRVNLQTGETEVAVPEESPLTLRNQEIPEEVAIAIGSYLSNAQLLGQRTAELHLALSSDTDDPNFAPEPFSLFYRRSIYQYSRNLTGQVMLRLRKKLENLPPDTQNLAKQVLSHQDYILGRFQMLLDLKITGMRTRCHGDYSLEEILYTGKDFWVLDFEGETYRTLSERRMKRSPLRDVAAMLQSFDYATRLALRNEVENGMIRPENLPQMKDWSRIWYHWVASRFLGSYLEVASQDGFLPRSHQELQVLLDSYLLERIIQSVDFHHHTRQEFIDIPLQQLLELV
ncbi:maltose alpha-D-glucosyltransferase [Lyngbya sp. CCY1209]|uniref:maltose alpha-D-glucosyltransferase n=1 Tax=Lyngbya sp. CCY1209 TaxID=2886103 RepID=UPI002D2141F7|nr:maltose alpha-D-glucosyltransferase [Lyngbya sp. CCY1209]MEB3887012.1 maltose alpha-D-glucosyltransferase [Lyngbya sp. CCY1209]